jgi:hypothetical protein
MPSYPLDLVAEYTLAIGRDQANVWKRIQDYMKQIGDTETLKNVAGLDPGNTLEFYDDYGITLTNFVYQTQDPVFAPEMVSERVYENDGDTEISEDFSYSKALEESFTFGFTEGLKVGLQATVSAGLPLVGEAEVQISGEVSFEANQSWTQTETKTWEVRTTVPVPAHSTTKVQGYVRNAKIDATFSGIVRATKGKVLTWFKLNDGTFTETPIPLVVLLTEDQRTFGVGGNFEGVEGVSAYTKVEKIPGTSSARKAS